MLSAVIPSVHSYPAVPLAGQPVHQRYVHSGPLVLGVAPLKSPTPTEDRDRTVSRRSEPSSRTALMGEQPNPWDLLQPQDATSRHRGAKPFRRCGLLGRISLLSPGWLHRHWRAGFTASHLSWTTRPELQHLAVVKVHGVFPSNHGYSASSPRLQFHRIPRRDSAQVVTPFVQVGTSRFSSVSGGADYPFTLAQLGEYDLSRITPPPARIHPAR